MTAQPKRGRPALPAAAKRRNRSIRVSESEWKLVVEAAAAAGKPVLTWVREVLLGAASAR